MRDLRLRLLTVAAFLLAALLFYGCDSASGPDAEGSLTEAGDEPPPPPPPPSAGSFSGAHKKAASARLAGSGCHLFDSSSEIPDGYGVPWDVFSGREELLLKADCIDDATVKISAGKGSSNQIVYKQGHVLRNGAWVPIDFTGEKLLGGNWYRGSAGATVARTEFFLAYVCTSTGSEWKCGCRDQQCAQSFWQLQRVEAAPTVEADPTFVWPVNDPAISQHYAIESGRGYHTGIDMYSSSGDLTIRSAAAGTARVIPNGTLKSTLNCPNNNHCMGNVVIVDHGNRLFTLYAHLDEITISDEEDVAAGQQIGVMGNTGAEDTGVHLHFELRLWNVIGNLDDDKGKKWGYTLSLPNLWGYLNPYPYLEYDSIEQTAPTAVRVSGDQIVRTGPDGSYSKEVVTTVEDGQRLASFAERGNWRQVYLASEYGPATGWVRANDITHDLLQIDDPTRGLAGVKVRAAPTVDSDKRSFVWDTQLFVYDEVASGGGCTEPWYKIPLAANAPGDFGWVCGEYASAD